MVLVRAVGWLLLAFSVAALVYDGLAWWSAGTFRLAPVGELWARLDPAALLALEKSWGSALPDVWQWLVLPLIAVPAVPLFAGLGVALLWIGRSRDREDEPVGFVLGTRAPRRRRRSGGLS